MRGSLREQSEYLLDHDFTMTLVMGYNTPLHYKVAKRWHELEQSASAHDNILQTYPEALRLAADLADQNRQLTSQVSDMQPDVEALERIAKCDGSLCLTDAAKTLQIRPKDLITYLEANRWIYRRYGNEAWVGFQEKIRLGLLEHKVITITHGNHEVEFRYQVRVTP